jgi:DNA polymerase IIIc chi subunit
VKEMNEYINNNENSNTEEIININENVNLHEIVVIDEEPAAIEVPTIEALIEVVGLDDEDRIPARMRFRHYKAQGYAIQSIDLSQPRKAS